MIEAKDYNKLTFQERRELREQYIEQQDGKCIYCGGELNNQPPKNITDKQINWSLFPENFLKDPVHMQHDHVSGLTEGAVHAYCNAVMWQYEGK
jgi:hypothetical protein